MDAHTSKDTTIPVDIKAPSPAVEVKTHTKTPSHETDFLCYDLYPVSHMSLEDLSRQVQAIIIPHCKWAPASFCPMKDDPVMGINHLHVTCILQNQDDTTLIKIEEALSSITHGNKKGVSSVAFLGVSHTPTFLPSSSPFFHLSPFSPFLHPPPSGPSPPHPCSSPRPSKQTPPYLLLPSLFSSLSFHSKHLSFLHM